MSGPRQFDIHRMRDGALVLIVQSDMIDAAQTRIVAPLIPADTGLLDIRGLSPSLWIGETQYRVAMQGLSAISITRLGPKLGEASGIRDEIVRALDLLFTGV